MFLPGIAGNKLRADLPIFPCCLNVWPMSVLDRSRIPFLDVRPDGVTSAHDVRPGEILATVVGQEIYRPALKRFQAWKKAREIREFVGVEYDWRIGVRAAAATLVAELQPRCGNGAVWLVGHSTGGLVIKEALRQMQVLAEAKRALAPERCLDGGGVFFLATPHVGAPKAIGAMVDPDLFFGTMIARKLADEERFAEALRNWLTAWELMPPGPLAEHPEAWEAWFSPEYPMKNVAEKHLNWKLAAVARAVHAALTRERTIRELPVYNVFGWASKTPYSYGPGRPGGGGCVALHSSAHVDKYGRGDGTVPGWSATWEGSGLRMRSQYGVRPAVISGRRYGAEHASIPNHAGVLGLLHDVVVRGKAYPAPAAGSGLVRGPVAVAHALQPQSWPAPTC